MDAKKDRLNKIGIFYSWEIINDDIAVKHIDKSFSKYGETGIPKEIIWFFKCDSLKYGEKKLVKLKYEERIYEAHFEKGKDASARTRLLWTTELKNSINDKLKCEGVQYYARFEKKDDDFYEVQLIDNNIILSEDDSLITEEYVCYKEGTKKQVYSTKYERSVENRRNAIKIHGTKCMACGFDFSEFYGEYGKDYIEVHHIKPLADVNAEIDINPYTDLVCVCSNCHKMIHHKRNSILSIEELKQLIFENNKKRC